ncbi:hypothetical protein NI343_004283 [Salmonella enterica]|nr:hypothetical protein [Salmonella enterica]EJJ4374846.1 hypothetical protein [Salmonella enterica]EKB5296949.1 hypothetical protein [Salmonella enterica]EKC2468900.1 hypothetical protein [Salmonella enterica]EKC2481487.1 hypothetical protein [Salmonella enterica]
MFAPENSFMVELCNAVPKRSLLDLLFFCFISLSYVVMVRGVLAAFRSFKMTKAKNIFCFQPVNFSLRSFLIVDLANIGNLWHSVPNRFFVKRQYWRGLAYRFAQIYLAKNFYRGKRKRGGLVPRSSSGLVAPSNLPVACAYAFRCYERDLRQARCFFI